MPAPTTATAPAPTAGMKSRSPSVQPGSSSCHIPSPTTDPATAPLPIVVSHRARRRRWCRLLSSARKVCASSVVTCWEAIGPRGRSCVALLGEDVVSACASAVLLCTCIHAGSESWAAQGVAGAASKRPQTRATNTEVECIVIADELRQVTESWSSVDASGQRQSQRSQTARSEKSFRSL